MDLANWMGCIKNEIKDKKLSEIVIPGSHDSGTYCINRKSKRTYLLPNLLCLNPVVDLVGATWSKTQEYSIAEQLILGVRYIDLRVFFDSDTNTKYLVHGFEANELFNELDDVKDFVENHPSEIVILDMCHIYKCNEMNASNIMKKVEELFRNKLCPQPPQNTSLLTYGEMMAAGKQVIVMVTEHPGEFNSTYKYSDLKSQFSWIWSHEVNFNSPWADTTDVKYLYQFLKKTMAEKRAPNCFHGTAAILTPETGDIIRGLYKRPHNLKQLVDDLNPNLPGWFEEFHKSYNLNIAIADFLTPRLMNLLVNLNTSGSSE